MSSDWITNNSEKIVAVAKRIDAWADKGQEFGILRDEIQDHVGPQEWANFCVQMSIFLLEDLDE